MKFVPVPIVGGPTDGQTVLFCIWETRKKDYAAFAEASLGVDSSWKNLRFRGVPVSEGPDHPMANVSWEDARAFCQWLTKKERSEGRISSVHRYRLPTDHEWSCAVGIGDREDPRMSPMDKNGKVEGVYSWGTQWPPPNSVGNYLDQTAARHVTDVGPVGSYDDGFATTAPVGSFNANAAGLFDMGGNLCELCEDWHSTEQNERVLRGASWVMTPDVDLLSFRLGIAPVDRRVLSGFRCVLVHETASEASGAAANPPEANLGTNKPVGGQNEGSGQPRDQDEPRGGGRLSIETQSGDGRAHFRWLTVRLQRVLDGEPVAIFTPSRDEMRYILQLKVARDAVLTCLLRWEKFQSAVQLADQLPFGPHFNNMSADQALSELERIKADVNGFEPAVRQLVDQLNALVAAGPQFLQERPGLAQKHSAIASSVEDGISFKVANAEARVALLSLRQKIDAMLDEVSGDSKIGRLSNGQAPTVASKDQGDRAPLIPAVAGRADPVASPDPIGPPQDRMEDGSPWSRSAIVTGLASGRQYREGQLVHRAMKLRVVDTDQVAFVGKPFLCVVMLEVSSFYFGKYESTETTHYAFEIEEMYYRNHKFSAYMERGRAAAIRQALLDAPHGKVVGFALLRIDPERFNRGSTLQLELLDFFPIVGSSGTKEDQ